MTDLLQKLFDSIPEPKENVVEKVSLSDVLPDIMDFIEPKNKEDKNKK